MSAAEPLGLAHVDGPSVGSLAALVHVAEGDEALAFQPGQRLLIGAVVAVVVGDRHAHHLPLLVAGGERTLGLVDAQAHPATDEAKPGVPHQRARQQPGLGRHLEAVADGQHAARPHSARFTTSAMIGERAAMAPARR